ncbi:hypothetical protein [Aurantimonas sp. VKM B-3413]|uniref:hypothetical protein n=1 Tax=Aurantimonas sp. VKM B-3413 TaxID=2779401 RepID=UPI001E3D0AF2|nr:hypothetical protein [Aurantimonas sp. VKM B-3413]MCB8840238.1 hypothetical protein [Aurantimonas sp. VKM B-3413]
MTADALDRWITFEVRFWRGLVTSPGDKAFLSTWADLVRRTAPHVTGRVVFLPRVEADSAFTPPQPYLSMPAALEAEWQGYEAAWQGFLDRNPRARLAHFLGWISETNHAASWPTGWETAIRDWVRAGCPDPRPFDDRIGIGSPGWRRELVETAAAAGPGWPVEWNDRLAWLPDGENEPTPDPALDGLGLRAE